MPADHPIRARESISVLRLMPKVRQTAALVAPPSTAVITAPSFSASMATGRPPRGLRGWRGGGRAPRGAPPAGRRKPSLHALLDQRSLELRERAEDVKQELALRRGGVHLLGQRTEGDAAGLEIGHRGEQVR